MTETSKATAPNAAHEPHGFRRKMVGKVIKDKMHKTVVVECIVSSKDALYGKYVRARKRYKAHDETNTYGSAHRGWRYRDREGAVQEQ